MSKLREYRIAAGLTQEQVAQKLDIKPSSVSYWESGATKPCAKNVRKLARLYKRKESEIMEASA